jgi:uncharacterized protein (DUF2141 family)
MMYCAARVLAVCFLAAGAAAQQDSGQFSLAGTVIDARSGEVIKRAQVILTHFGAPSSEDAPPPIRASPPTDLTTFTDSAGVFRFSALSAGTYSISAQKPGFTEIRTSGTADIPGSMKLTASVEDLRLKLSPLGVITGKVVDQEGQPLRGVNVIALSQRMEDGVRRTQAVRNVATNDRGEYRLWNFRPGKYYIKAAGRTGGTYLYAGDVAPRFTADESFSPAYFGGGKTLDSAQPINIEPGSESRADINLTMEPSHKIRGALGNFAPRRTVKFELLSGDEDVSPSRVSVNGDTGKFEIQDVIPGAYALRATQGETSAEIPVNVTPTDVDGLCRSRQVWTSEFTLNLQASPKQPIPIFAFETDPTPTAATFAASRCILPAAVPA